MAHFNVPQSPKLYTERLTSFKGVDFANNPSQVESYRSPDAVNIMSDSSGKPAKRTGYETVASFNSQINGIFRLATEDTERFVVHAGTSLYEWTRVDGDFSSTGTQIYTGMNNIRSTAFQHDKKLYILDGKKYLCYGEFDNAFSVKPVTDIATIPLVIISRNPNGTGGTQKEQINILTKKRTYSFFGTESDKAYHLSSTDDTKLTNTPVTAKIMASDGTWSNKLENTDFTVDRAKGIITFNTAPGKSPSGSADNVKITFECNDIKIDGIEEESKSSIDLINGCTIAVQYGASGSTDRVFLSGNDKAKNFHYWSATNDPCNFPAYNYAYLGQDSSAIMGYSLINDMLAVHKQDNEQDQTIFLVGGSYNSETGRTDFAITGSVAGVGAVSKYCFQRLDTEPLFLARQGVYAITTQYLTTERYAQSRSWYVNPRLVNEADLSEAVAKEFNNYYYLAVNGHVYVADGRQKVYERNAPQSTYQYEWYYLDNINCRIWWEYNGQLYFGTDDGRIKRFKSEHEGTVAHIYNDDGQVIRAYWMTKLFTFDTLQRYKTLKGFWCMQSPYGRSSIDIYYRTKGMERLVKHSTMDIFDWNDIDFTRLTFTTDDSPMIIATNAKEKRFMLIQFKLENNVLGEGFGFYEAECAYNITGKYKG